MVPTVERGLREVDFWSIETAGDRPSMKSTSGLSIWPRNWRAGAARGTTARRRPLAQTGTLCAAEVAAAGQPGDADQGVAGQVEVDVLEVVLAGAADDETVHVIPVGRWAGGSGRCW